MTGWVFARRLWIDIKREMRFRGRALASAFSVSRSIEAPAAPAREPVDLIAALNQVGAGISAWDWDIDRGTFQFNREVMDRYGVEAEASRGDLHSLVERSVYSEDRKRFREEMVSALKGQRPLCIEYRAVAADGTFRSAQLRGVIYRRPNGRAYRVVGFTSDTTPQQEAAAKARSDANKQRQLFERLSLATEAAGIGVWDWDLSTGKLGTDANMAGIFKDANFDGITKGDEFIKRILHADDRERFLNTMRAALAVGGGERVSIDFRYMRSDGGIHHAELHGRVIRDSGGQAVRLLCVSWNITAKVEAQSQLAQHNAAQQVLLERLNLATEVAELDVWDWDFVTDRILGDVSHPEMYGIDRLDHHDVRARIASLIHPEDAPGYFAALNKAIDSGETFSYRFRVLGRDGSTRQVQSNARIFRNGEGKAIRMLGVSQDVSDEMRHLDELRRQTEEERALRDRLNLATHTAGIAIWDKDLVHGDFVCNEQFWKMFGLKPNNRLKVHEGIHPDAREQALAPLNAAFGDPTSDEILPVRHRTSNPRSEPQYVQTHMRVFRDANGKATRLLGVTWDVTAEERRNEELQRQTETERALVNRLSVATQAAGIGPWEYDLIANRFSWVGTTLEILGLRDIPPAEYFDAISNSAVPEDRHILRQATVDALAKNLEVFSYVYRTNGTDGQVHHLKNFARILRSGRGTPYRLVGVTWDVSEEVAAAEQLKQQAEHERKLTERLNIATSAANIASWEIDLVAARFLWIENPIKRIERGDDANITLDDFSNYIVPEDRDLMSNAIRDALAAGSDRLGFRYRTYANDGSILHVQAYARLILDDSKRPVRVLGVTWDVTHEVEASEKLEQQARYEREMLERLNVATEGAGISMWEFDLKTNRHSWLSKRLAILGLNDVPFDGFHDALRGIMMPEDRHIITDIPKEALLSGKKDYSYRFRVTGTDGQLHHLQNYVRVLRGSRGAAYRLVGVTWDVTQEVTTTAQMAEQARKERALTERLSVATQSAGISTWELDLVAAKFLWVENPLDAATDARGGNAELSNFARRIHPDDRSLMSSEIKKAAKENRDIIRYCYRIYRLDGSIAYIQTYAKLYFNDRLRATRALGVSWDSTKEVEAAAKLADAERRLERASLSSSEGHWEAELATGYLWLSSSFHTLLGYRSGELETKLGTLDFLIHEDDRLAYNAALGAHLSSNVAFNFELRLRMSDGNYRWFGMRGAAERSDDGAPKLVAGAIHDVHQQKLIEDALQMAQRRFERAINGTQDGLWELDVDSGDAWCSPRLGLLLGYAADQLGARNFLKSLIHPDDAAKLENVTRSHYSENTPFDLEVRLRTRGGEHRWYRARATAERDHNGRALRLSGSLQDVTEARAAREELLRATEAAEAANRAKSAFLANMSHEIRTPMNGIVGMTGLLFDTELNRTQREYADTIRGSADSLLTIINDILDFSKIEAGKLDLEYIDVDLRLLVEDVGSMMAFQAANKGLELIVNVHPETPDRVKGDPQRLRQCLVNLLGNAIKFTKTGEIAIDVCAIGRHEGRVLTHFEIRDTGIGIPQATLKTLFQPFVQADSSTTRHFGGTGLGLSIVRRLIEMMGGQVGVVSELGKGSNFFFTLSLEQVESEKASASAGPNDGRILIVDDNATNRRVLRLQLEHNGYRIITADSGADALAELHAAAARGQPIDMTITDYQMPDMDGAMLAARIAAEPSFASTRLIMLTSLDKQGDTQRLAALGFAAYLTKPIRRDELLTCVRRVFEGEARQWQMEIRPMITRNTLAQIDAQQKFNGRVLLVEDNEVNQKVAGRVLERMGCSVRIAEHGEVGVAAFIAESFDLILMDLQMPVMDGMAAARRIREIEALDGDRKRTPIVALTANAMKGDRELCEAAGMDDYLTKPLEVERLRLALSRFGLAVNTTGNSLPAPRPAYEQPFSAHAPPIDLGQLNRLVDGDDEFMRELLVTFLDSGAQQIADIEAATEAFDRPAIARAAHKLKGGCANIHATAMRKLAYEIESAASTAEKGILSDLGKQLRLEYLRAEKFLNDPSVMPVPLRAAS